MQWEKGLKEKEPRVGNVSIAMNLGTLPGNAQTQLNATLVERKDTREQTAGITPKEEQANQTGQFNNQGQYPVKGNFNQSKGQGKGWFNNWQGNSSQWGKGGYQGKGVNEVEDGQNALNWASQGMSLGKVDSIDFEPKKIVLKPPTPITLADYLEEPWNMW